MYMLLACFLALLVPSGAVVQELELELETTTGRLLGLRSILQTDLEYFNVSYYRGIPYAEPPIGDLRFEKPVPKEPWEGVFNATKWGVSCPQNPYGDNWMGRALPSDEQDEDCLQLNVYAPSYYDPDNPYAVMVWIHGGAYVSGQGMMYESSFLSGLHEVVVITINYRLGALGFVATSDDHLPGNYGLFDQIEALEWIKANVAVFGGDPDRITIFGESAGGFSCSILSHTHHTKHTDLFHRAISQSGTVYPGILLPNNVAYDFAFTLGENIGCGDAADSKELVDCLKTKPYEDFVEAQKGMLFVAIEDNDMITSPIEDFMKNSDFNQYDILMGSNSYEATLILPRIPQQFQPFEGMERFVFNVLVGIHIQLWFEKEQSRVRDATLFQYEDHENPDDNDIRHEQYVHFFNDLVFLAPTVGNARLHAPQVDSGPPDLPIELPPPGWPLPFPYQKDSPEAKEYLEKLLHAVKEEMDKPRTKSTQGSTYHYVFDILPSFYSGPEYVYGATHAAEIIFVFEHMTETTHAPFIPYSGTTEEIKLSKQMATYWSNFAKTGNPNEPVKTIKHQFEDKEEALVYWPEFNNTEEATMYFTLNMNDDNVKYRYRNEYINFWLDYIPKLINYTSECPAQEECPSPEECPDPVSGQQVITPHFGMTFLLILTAYVYRVFN